MVERTSSYAKWQLVTAFLCAGLVVIAVLFWTSLKNPSQIAVAERQSDYADPSECTACHATIAASYRKTGMGRSFYRPTVNNVIENYTSGNQFDHQLSGMRYQMIERDGKFFQRRSTIGFDGKEDNIVEDQVDYIVGSGNHARTYLHRTSQGNLIELPVSWYTEMSGHWAMSPSFDNPLQKDIRGEITPECMFCHNSYPQLNSDSAVSEAEDGIFPQKMPEGIDCQRCHGPGKAHIAAARANKPAEEVRHAIVNPQKLGRDRQMEVCMECHLGTNETHTPSEIRSFERTAFSYKPGEALGDYKRYFQAPLDANHPESSVAHAAYRLQQSQCYLKSQMTCLTCHDPHDIPRGQDATQKYSEKCEGCHTNVKHTVALPANETCLSCHMPKKRNEGSVNVVMTDHYIQRFRLAGDLLAPMTEKAVPQDKRRVDQYYPRNDADKPEAKLYLAIARVDDGDGKGIVDLQKLIEEQSPNNPKPYLELGRAFGRRGKYQEAIDWLEVALAKKPDDLQSIREIAPALISAGQKDRAISLLQHAMILYPKDNLLATDLGYVFLHAGQLTEARQALDRAIELNPEHSDAYNLRGLVALKREDMASAERDFREAIRWQPNSPQPRNNLASLLMSSRNFAEAEFHLEAALKANPLYADTHHSLGLLYIFTSAIPKADAELHKAAELNPNSAEVHSDLADLLATEGSNTEAAKEYERALKLDPNQADVQLGLGLAYLRSHRLAEAKQHLLLAAASHDESVARAATEALQQLQR